MSNAHNKDGKYRGIIDEIRENEGYDLEGALRILLGIL